MLVQEISLITIDDLEQDKLQLSLKSEATVIARVGEAAGSAAKRVDSANAELLVTLTDNNRPVGLLFRSAFIAQMDALGMPARSMEGSVQLIERASDKILRQFLAEMSSNRPPIFWCDRGHYTAENPCSIHYG